MIKKAKANVGIGPFGERKQETLIELQDNRSQKQIQQQQQQDEMNLRMLEEQEANIRQLEVCVFYEFKIINRRSNTVFLYDVIFFNSNFSE